MALSGSVATSAYTTSSGNNWTVVLNWTATQSVATNKSTISWNIKANYSGSSTSTYVVVGEVKATINGTQVFYRDTSKRSECKKDTQIASGTIEVDHNNDGSKSVAMKIEAGIYVWAISETGSKTFTLDTIPRASSITSASGVTLGNACSIKWTPNATSFRFKVKFSLGSWSYTTGAIHPNTTSEYTYSSYTIPLAVANQLPSATTGTMTATLYTYTDSAAKNQCGSATTKTFTVTVPSSVVPTIGTLTATIDNSANSVVNGWGLAVAGYTKVKVTATASGAYSSTISSFTISGGYSKTVSGTSLSYTGGIITSSGSKTFKVVAKDTRGRSSTQAATSAITFYAYSKPSITSFTTARDETNPNLMVVKHFPLDVLCIGISQVCPEIRQLSGLHGPECSSDRIQHGYGAYDGRPGYHRCWQRCKICGQCIQSCRRQCSSNRNRRCSNGICCRICFQIQPQLLCP